MKLNNKGFTLVEMILAFSITFAMIYFLMDLVINFKNNNDDLIIETLVKTDQSIITNKLMEYAIAEEGEFNCDSLIVANNKVSYTDINGNTQIIDVVDERAVVNKDSCKVEMGVVSIKLSLDVEQMKDDNFDVVIDYKYNIGDMIPPTCTLHVDGTTITASASDDEGGSGIKYAGFNSSYEGEQKSSIIIDTAKTYTYYVSDYGNNKVQCVADIKDTIKGSACYGDGKDASGCYRLVNGSCKWWSCTWGCTQHGVTGHQTIKTSGSSCTSPYGYNCGLSGQTCTDYAQVREYIGEEPTYNCDSDYTKLNNDYCYKITNSN